MFEEFPNLFPSKRDARIVMSNAPERNTFDTRGAARRARPDFFGSFPAARASNGCSLK
jgi:hypothetical protein